MPRFRVLPYKQGSASAKALATALGGKVLKLVGSTFKPKDGDVIINWGNTNPQQEVNPDLFAHIHTYYNDMDNIRNASNKLRFFNMIKEVNPNIIPRFWTDKEDILDDAYPIVCRTILAGHSGAGIVIADTPNDLVAAPLYVEYKKKKDEFRVHVGKKTSLVGQDDHDDNDGGYSTTVTTIAIQRKARRQDCENPNWQVRNHDNGFIYRRTNVNCPPSVIEAASEAFLATSLDFGAVDVIWNEHEQRPYVLEINTAPGLEGQTIGDYATFFRQAAN